MYYFVSDSVRFKPRTGRVTRVLIIQFIFVHNNLDLLEALNKLFKIGHLIILDVNAKNKDN